MKLLLNRIDYLYVASIPVLILTVLGLLSYEGSPLVFVAFTFVSNWLLYLGFNSRHNFFDSFIAVFFWLGFWLKLTCRLVFYKGTFYEPTGLFDFSPSSYDRVLIVASIGLSGFIFASLLRRRLFFYSISHKPMDEIVKWYGKYRGIIWLVFALGFISYSALNFQSHFYQRGIVPPASPPYGLNGILKWLLLFGGSAIAAYMISCELRLKKGNASLAPILLAFTETFCSSTSMLSRGMILNSAAIAWGVLKQFKEQMLTIPMRKIMIALLYFLTLFVVSFVVVKSYRQKLFKSSELSSFSTSTIGSFSNLVRGNRALFLDRWVGIESVMAISSHPGLGWHTLNQALRERKQVGRLSFYDRTFISSPYVNDDLERLSFVSLPGALGFFFYAGGYVFLGLAMFSLGIIGAFIEWMAFKFSGGAIVFSSVIAQVIAYRYAHFGYAPRESYLLFGAVFLTILLAWVARRAAACMVPVDE